MSSSNMLGVKKKKKKGKKKRSKGAKDLDLSAIAIAIVGVLTSSEAIDLFSNVTGSNDEDFGIIVDAIREFTDQASDDTDFLNAIAEALSQEKDADDPKVIKVGITLLSKIILKVTGATFQGETGPGKAGEGIVIPDVETDDPLAVLSGSGGGGNQQGIRDELALVSVEILGQTGIVSDETTKKLLAFRDGGGSGGSTG